ncbi:sulfatase [Psychrosphaera sp. B3R10]|uniref:sulfatase n=1 Tax=unclassified Psychrosphaera TaxID=2641570 RepID=UPI001C0859F3|nr:MULTISPECIES: sulfatase [unclassified Psychrosphaera]MBU2881737.1 sulfatase [Psychrosphaera sp. I2R16]MBU2990078.1 sulfatase [Psychrosphaera sp. B3R10]
MSKVKSTLLAAGLVSSYILSGMIAGEADAATLFKSKQKQPNVVLFFVDDMGWASRTARDDVYETPNIDQIATDGIEFESAYIPTPTCSPSRAALVTGQHPARIGMPRHIPHKPQHGFDKFGRTETKFNFWQKDPAQVPSVNWLETDYVTYAEALKEQGYFNMFIGKWHLGHEGYHPIDQGFDAQIGATNWGHPHSYYPPYFKNSEVYNEVKERYLTDKLTDDAVEFIASYDKNQPFMMSMWYYAIHTPFQGRKDLVEHFEKKGLSGKKAHHAALVSGIDESIGRIRKALKASGLDKNTVIIFLSDQGGILENKPLHGGKKLDTLYEGGARVPLFVSWPNVTNPGTKISTPVQSTDLFPTLVELAGGDPKNYQNLDGISLLSAITNGTKIERGAPLFGYRAYEDLYASVREGDWKIVAYRSGIVKLYNVVLDVSESNDVAKIYPKKLQELKAKLIDWEKDLNIDKYSGVQ